ncbi:hypothetical protein MFIFM68171_07289 [Madurella fahalii]|uniref:Uncharacterized protein n=1 Tax=Madurella fahalii TaxID=1157608 RepID=A0ABQ0GH46_9PEZI
MANLLHHHRHHEPEIAQEANIFAYLTHPDDSYTADHTYRADLSLMARAHFIHSINSAESRKELQAIGQMA